MVHWNFYEEQVEYFFYFLLLVQLLRKLNMDKPVSLSGEKEFKPTEGEIVTECDTSPDPNTSSPSIYEVPRAVSGWTAKIKVANLK